jgi:hypothetical protein
MNRFLPIRDFLAWPIVIVLLAGCAGSANPSLTPATPTPSPSHVVSVATRTQVATASPIATPGPTRSAPSFAPVAAVTGTDSCPGLNPDWTIDPDGTAHVRDLAIECVDRTDDPRVTGTATGNWSMDVWGSLNRGAGVQWGTIRLVNDGGAWEGKLSGIAAVPEPGDTILIWYTGTGGYAGLSYFQLLTGHDPWRIQGQIFPGVPPIPMGTPMISVGTPAPAATAGPDEGPSPAPTTITYGPATVVTGTAQCPGLDIKAFSWTTDPDGAQRVRNDFHANRCTVTTGDSRVSGSRSSTWNIDFWGDLSVPRGALVQWGTARLQNDGGAWEGRATGVGSSFIRGDIIVNWYTGTGDYAGLAYFELWRGSNPYQIDGLIFPGDPPPLN